MNQKSRRALCRLRSKRFAFVWKATSVRSARAKKPLASPALFEAAGLRCSMRFSGGTSAFGRWKEEFAGHFVRKCPVQPSGQGLVRAPRGSLGARPLCTIRGFVCRVLESVMNRANVLAEIS